MRKVYRIKVRMKKDLLRGLLDNLICFDCERISVANMTREKDHGCWRGVGGLQRIWRVSLCGIQYGYPLE